MRKRVALTACLSLALLFFALSGSLRGAKGEAATPASSPAGKAILPAQPTKRVTRVTQAPEVESGQTATLLPDGRWLIVGGEGKSGPQASVVIKDSRAGKAMTFGDGLRQPRMRHTATLLPDGSVLIYGGVGADRKVTGSAEILDPRTGKSESIPSGDLIPRAEHTATLLSDGHVLIAGGIDDSSKAISKIDLWDPQTKSSITLPSGLRSVRRRHTATLLPDGNVLLWGGLKAGKTNVEDGEIYEIDKQGFSWTGVRPSRDDGAPYVVFSSPKDGEASVPRDARLALRFSKPLSVESLNSGTATLAGPDGQVAVRVVPSEGGMLGFVTPQEPFQIGVMYTLSLNGVTDDSDQPLAPLTISFTTIMPEEHEHGPGHQQEGHDDHGREQSSTLQSKDDETWVPNARNPYGDWRSNRGESPWQKLAPLQAEPGVTALSGQVLKINGQPLANVGLQIGGKATRTDSTGRFLLADIPAGHQHLLIKGYTANSPGKSYLMCESGVNVLGGKTNVLPYTIWLATIDTKHVVQIPVPTTREVVVTNPLIPGLEIHIPAGVKLRTYDGSYLSSMSLTPIPLDRTTLPLPAGATFFFTPQAHKAVVESVDGSSNVGFRIVYPNTTGLKPGATVNLWNYDPDLTNGWYVYGKGTVTRDGRQIVPNPGVMLKKLNCYGGFFDSDAPPWGPVPGGGAEDGDPVDLGTGLFVYDKTDMMLPDTMPITLSRTYRPNDLQGRPFGIGATHPYEMKIIGDNGSITPTFAELILPDGGRIRYERTNPGGTPYAFEHTATPTKFYKSTLVAVSRGSIGGWDLRLLDGTVLQFIKRSRGFGIHSVDVRLVGIVNRYGNTLIITRDEFLRITRISSPNGRWMEFSYEPDPANDYRIVEARDNVGRTVGYTYDAVGRLWKVTDVNGGVTEYTYDGASRMQTIKDPRGIVFLTNEYDANGRVFRQTQADTTTYQFAYTTDASGRVTQTDITRPRGDIRRVTFDSSGYVLTDTYAVGKPEQQTVTYEREAGTNKSLNVTDALGRRTKYTYDAKGNVAGVTSMDGTAAATTTQFTYDPRFNQLASVTNPLQHTSAFSYDDKGNLTSIMAPSNSQFTFTYNSAGQVLTATNPLQHTTQYVYDSGALVEIRNPMGRTTKYFSDDAGRLISLVNPLGHTTRFEYDAQSHVTKVVDALGGGCSFAYDPNGNLINVTDARNKVTTFTYDSMDRVATRTDPLSKVETYSYDEAGNPKKFTDRRGKATTFRHDFLNRRTFVGFGTVGEGEGATYESNISYTYDAAHRLKESIDSLSGTTTLNYNDLARTFSETTPKGAVTSSYDSAGRLTGKTITGQSPISYTYDYADRLIGITQGADMVGISYDAANRRERLTLPNGTVTEYGYDIASQLKSITYSSGAAVLGDLAYEYDDAGKRTRVGGSFARSLMPQALSSVTYDDANRLTQKGATGFTYDTNGNLISDGVNTYTWNARNQLVSIAGSVAANFQYDAFGRRVDKTINGQTTGYLYDGANAVQELQGTTPIANRLTGTIDQVFTRTDAGGTQTFLTDGLGSTVGLSDSDGTLQTQYTYEPFGNTTSSGSANNNVSQFTGRENDGSAGLYYYRTRYYSPTLQRFISEDPAGLAGGLNLYAYVENDPVNFVDPQGLWPTTVFEVHQDSATRVLSSNLTPNELQGLRQSLYEADQSEFQTVPMSYRHAMTPGGTPEAEARQNANDFFRDNINKARQASSSEDAMRHLGAAMHALQDATSPEHAGFKPYHGGNGEYLAHIYGELFDPGAGSNLDGATAAAYAYYAGCRPMPDDVFGGLKPDMFGAQGGRKR